MYNITLKKLSNRILNDNIDTHRYEYILSSIPDDSKYEYYYIVSPESFFADANDLKAMVNIESHIPTSILNKIKQQKCLLIIDFSYEANGLCSDIILAEENGNNSHTIDMYGPVSEYIKKHGIGDNVKFVSMMEDANRFANYVKLYSCPSVPMRYNQFRYDDYEHLLNVVGPNKNAIWLNRRIRDHRVNLIAKCVDKKINFDDFNFSFIGSKFEQYQSLDADSDKKSILLCNHVGDSNANEVLKHFGKIVGLDTNKSTKEMDQWLATSDIGRVIEMLKIRSNSAYEIVSEFTHNDIGVHFSEKFTLPILSKKPFLISGDRYIIKELQKLGFKTFNDFWPEDYDNHTEHHNDTQIKTRTESLADTIEFIENNFHTTENYTRDIYGNVIYCDKMQEIVEHNYNHFLKVYCPKLFNNWQNVFAKDKDVMPLSGLHPKEAEYLVTRDDTWEDAVWYHNNTNHIFVPIWRNGNTFFHKNCAEKYDYRLVKKKDLKDWRTIPAYAFLRLPEKRITGQLWRAFKNSNVTPTILQNTEDWSTLDMHLITQSEFLKDFNLVCTINLDTSTLHCNSYKSKFSSVDNDISLIINKVYNHTISDKVELNSSAQDPEFINYIRDTTEQQWFKTKHKEYYKDDFYLTEEKNDDY